MSIRLRLTLWYSIILAVMMSTFSVALYFLLSFNLYSTAEEELKTQSNEIVKEIRYAEVETGKGTYYNIIPPRFNLFQSSNLYLQWISADGEVKQKSSNLVSYSLFWDQNTINKSKANIDYYEKGKVADATMLVYNNPFFINDTLVGIVQVGTRVDTIDSSLNSLKLSLLFIGLAMMIIATTFGLFLARKVLQPIDRVIDAANQIERGTDLDKRIEYYGPKDEIGQLTETFNNLLSRIQVMYNDMEEAYRKQRRFVSDASHELRTPLTTIRGNVDLLEKVWNQSSALGEYTSSPNRQLSLEAMRDISDEAQRMSRLVNDLLVLARADAGHELYKEAVEMSSLVEEVIRRAHFLPRHAEWVAGNLSALQGAYVMGSKDLLQQLLFIFIENGFKYTPDGYVKLDAVRTGRQIGLCIEDTGIGMDKEEVPHIFERFYRADESRGITLGTGLGLSIAKWILDQHGGSVEVRTTTGKGTTFMIWLPASFQVEVE